MPTKVFTGIQVKEMTAHGLKNVVLLPIDATIKEEDVRVNVEKLTEMAYSKDNMYMVLENGTGLVMRGLTTKTVIFEPVFEEFITE
jgi:hypothetical protein